MSKHITSLEDARAVKAAPASVANYSRETT
jgi:hypothetical protein